VISNLHLNQVSLVSGTTGLRVATQGKVSGLYVVDGTFNKQRLRLECRRQQRLSTTNQNDFTNIHVSGTTTFSQPIASKASMGEAGNASFTGIAVVGSGYGATRRRHRSQSEVRTYAGGIAITGSTITNSGTGTATGCRRDDQGRNDAPQLFGQSASLTGVQAHQL